MPSTSRRLRAGVLSAVVVLVPTTGAVAAARAGLHAGTRALGETDPGGALLGLAALALSGVLAWAAAAAAAGVVEAWSTTSQAAPGTGTGTGPVSPAGVLPPDRVGRAAAVPVVRGRTALVSAGVAALVVAALTAPGAAASTGPAGRPAVVATQDGTAAPATRTPTTSTPTTSSPSTRTPTTVTPTTGTQTTSTPTTSTPTTSTPTTSTSSRATATSSPTAAASSSVPGEEAAATDPGAPAAAPAAGELAPRGSWSALVGEGFRAPRGAAVGSAALVTAPALRPTEADRGSVARASEVVVLAGDSLWSLAARHLGPGADATEVAEAWPRWWEANRAVVGDDPDLLLPGQRLVAPPP